MRALCAMGLGLLSLSAGPLYGQATTGQIQGRVTEAATGAPIAGVEVRVIGTTFSNLTDEDGSYFISGVPAGLRSVRVAHPGHRSVLVADERILAGRTTVLDFGLEAPAPAPPPDPDPDPDPDGEPLLIVGDRDPAAIGRRTSTRTTVGGDAVDRLPLDDAAEVVVLQPGVVETIEGPGLRGGRAGREAVLIDGVLSRSFGTGAANNLAVPTNALEQVDVDVGTFSAEFGGAGSGLVSYVTRTGTSALTGSFEAMSDQLGPDAWRTNFNRVELTLGGPVAGPVSFFVAGTASGQDAFATEFAPNRFVIDGSDTCDVENFCETANGGPGLGAPATFRLPRSSTTPGVSDFVDVTAPRFVEFDNGRTVPHGWNRSDLFHGTLSWQLPRGSRVNLSVTRNRDRDAGHAGFGTNFLSDGVDGARSTRSAYALSWFQTLERTADEQIALDLLVAYSRDRDTNGMLDQTWWRDHTDPTLGLFTGRMEFAFDETADRTVTGFDVFDPSDEFIQAYRSNGVPRDSLVLFPDRPDLTSTTQSLAGLNDNLRANPYAMATGFPLNGAGSEGLAKRSEDRFQARGALDWQLGGLHRIRAGAEYFAIALDAFDLPLAGGLPRPESADPRKIGVFVQDRLDFGKLLVDAGIRYDRLDTDVEYPRVPGFVFNVADSLKAGFVAYDAGTGAYVPQFDEPCGGVSPSNPNGTCLDNFVEAETKSEFSPRLGVGIAVSPNSALRLGYGRFVQAPPFFTGLMRNVNVDLQAGAPSAVFARDVDLPSTRRVELGYRVLLGDGLLVDVSAFDEERSGALAARSIQIDDPNTGAPIFVDVLANSDATTARGFEIGIDGSVGRLVDGRISYTFLDPEDDSVLQRARRHNLNLTGSLTFPGDWREGSVAGTILRDVGLFAILRARSGLRYATLANQGGGQIGPPVPGGLPVGAMAEESTPWTTAFDVRLTKGFRLGEELELQAFVDWRNPFDIENRSAVFLETGDVVNDLFRQSRLSSILGDTRLDGDNAVDDFDIRADSPENPFNVFMLLRAEQRFGNGDGVFTVAEQETAFGQRYENDFGVESRFRTSDQLMRLGMRLAF